MGGVLSCAAWPPDLFLNPSGDGIPRILLETSPSRKMFEVSSLVPGMNMCQADSSSHQHHLPGVWEEHILQSISAWAMADTSPAQALLWAGTGRGKAPSASSCRPAEGQVRCSWNPQGASGYHSLSLLEKAALRRPGWVRRVVEAEPSSSITCTGELQEPSCWKRQ